jgi:hypothetical protein
LDEVLLIAATKNPVIVDYVAYARRFEHRRLSVITIPALGNRIKEVADGCVIHDMSSALALESPAHNDLVNVVFFLNRRMTDYDRNLLDRFAEIAKNKRVQCVCLISSFRVHFEDTDASRAEQWAVKRLNHIPGRVVVIRPGFINSPTSVLRGHWRMFHFLSLVLPSHFKGCCLEGNLLFEAIERELNSKDSRKRRTFTLLGPNRSWREFFDLQGDQRPMPAFSRTCALILRFLLLGWLAGLFFHLFAWWIPRLRIWNFDTLRPASIQDLLTFYNKYNYQNVKVVGYNNGVRHFGQRYPGKTILSTVRCNRVAHLRDERARFDCGVTIRQAREFLISKDKDLHVVPNYSYVSLATAYFVPIHGSASEYSTLAETIEDVLLYDPKEDTFLKPARTDVEFGHHMYQVATHVLLIQLTLKTKSKTHYYRKKRKLKNLSSRHVLDFFKDERTANVEIRKAGAASKEVSVYHYYTFPPEGEAEALELPRDTLGSLWDRLESNAITAALFHGLTRRLAHHVELFLSADDFAVFWDTHNVLPLSKIQVRYIRRDGFPNSPFRDQDMISVDLFMLKKHKEAFHVYLKKTFRTARLNPGKHSM